MLPRTRAFIDWTARDHTMPSWEDDFAISGSLPSGVDRWSRYTPMLRPMRMRPISALVCAGIVVLGTACSGNDAKTADVSGDFLRSCGPAPGITVPLSGTVELESSSTTLRVSVGMSGHFNVRVAPGRYHLTGTSPSIDGGQVPCGPGASLDVRLGGVNHFQVICSIR